MQQFGNSKPKILSVQDTDRHAQAIFIKDNEDQVILTSDIRNTSENNKDNRDLASHVSLTNRDNLAAQRKIKQQAQMLLKLRDTFRSFKDKMETI